MILHDSFNRPFNAVLWDGVAPNGVKFEDYTNNLYKNEKGDIYYIHGINKKAYIWCCKANLNKHVRYLNAILSRK